MRLAWQPLQRAVLADMDERVRAEVVAQPAIQRVITVRRRQIWLVIDQVRIHAVAARRLDRDEHIAEAQPGERDVVVVHIARARRRPQRSIICRRFVSAKSSNHACVLRAGTRAGRQPKLRPPSATPCRTCTDRSTRPAAHRHRSASVRIAHVVAGGVQRVHQAQHRAGVSRPTALPMRDALAL